MLNKVKQRKQDGFTIIEVMIVLAIAGLIMVVVFLAVPALQRSGRNNALSTSANNVMTGVGDYVTNNGGSLPATFTAVAPSGGLVTIGATGTNQAKPKVESGVATVQIDDGTTPITSGSAVGTVQVVEGARATCNPTSTGITGTAASTRSYVVLFVAEGGSGKIVKCVGN